jgi:hypothetical protein
MVNKLMEFEPVPSANRHTGWSISSLSLGEFFFPLNR